MFPIWISSAAMEYYFKYMKDFVWFICMLIGKTKKKNKDKRTSASRFYVDTESSSIKQ